MKAIFNSYSFKTNFTRKVSLVRKYYINRKIF